MPSYPADGGMWPTGAQWRESKQDPFSTLPGSVNTVISPWEHWWLSFKWTAHWAPAERQYRQLQEVVTGSWRQTGSFSVPTLGVILLSVPGHLKVTR